jgi:hypothetical protein
MNRIFNFRLKITIYGNRKNQIDQDFITVYWRFAVTDKVPHLASHLLGVMARNISKNRKKIYNHPLYFLETFVDTERFYGICYKASNWKYLGDTTGRGKDEKSQRQTRSIKAVWGYCFCYSYDMLLRVS